MSSHIVGKPWRDINNYRKGSILEYDRKKGERDDPRASHWTDTDILHLWDTHRMNSILLFGEHRRHANSPGQHSASIPRRTLSASLALQTTCEFVHIRSLRSRRNLHQTGSTKSCTRLEIVRQRLLILLPLCLLISRTESFRAVFTCNVAITANSP